MIHLICFPGETTWSETAHTEKLHCLEAKGLTRESLQPIATDPLPLRKKIVFNYLTDLPPTAVSCKSTRASWAKRRYLIIFEEASKSGSFPVYMGLYIYYTGPGRAFLPAAAPSFFRAVFCGVHHPRELNA